MPIGTVHFMTTLTCYKILKIMYAINWQCESSTTPVLLNSYPLWFTNVWNTQWRNGHNCQFSEYVVIVSWNISQRRITSLSSLFRHPYQLACPLLSIPGCETLSGWWSATMRVAWSWIAILSSNCITRHARRGQQRPQNLDSIQYMYKLSMYLKEILSVSPCQRPRMIWHFMFAQVCWNIAPAKVPAS